MKKAMKNLIIFSILMFLGQSAFCYTLTSEQLNKAVLNKIEIQTKTNFGFDDFKINLTGIPKENIVTNETIAPKIEVVSQNQNFQPYTYKRIIIKDSKNNVVRTFSINVQTLVYQKVLTASSTIPFNSEINASNTTLERKEVSRFLNKTIANPLNAVSTRNYQKGGVILSDGIKQKAAVVKNSTVEIVFVSKKGMKITLQGKALKDGSIGETILVRSNKYNKTYNAVVNSANEVTVRI